MNSRYFREDHHQGLEWEFMKEQSGALGRAGDSLKKAIKHYRALPPSHPEREKALAAVSEALWQLQMQREFVGFVDSNLQTILAEFDVPKEALTKLGHQGD